MAGSGASEAILFIGAVIAATAFAGVFVTVLGQISSDVREQGSYMSDEIRSDITVINDPLAVSTSPLVILVKNTGSVDLSASETVVLLDGQISQDVTYDVIGSTDDEAWTQGSVLQMAVNDLSVGAGDHRVRVVAPTGIDSLLEFNA